MEIYILRHGIAEEAKAGDSDADRALTEAGREKLSRVLERARGAGVAPSLILTSPYRRAVETARIAGQELGCRRVIETGVLTPDGSPEEVWNEICAHFREKALLLAGHQPLLGMTVAYLLGSSQLQVDLKKAALVSIEQDRFTSAPEGRVEMDAHDAAGIIPTMMDILKATRRYEEWLATELTIVAPDLKLKHDVMAAELFPFFRATYYRWAQLWPKVCGDLASAPWVLPQAVGDLHVENFGTWRDTEGRLIWGVNDFDETWPLAYTNDLVRLAASAQMAIAENHLAIAMQDAALAILDG